MIQRHNPIKSKHIHVLIISNALIAVASVFICLFVMYNISLNENKSRLKELAQNQARIIESISKFDLETRKKYIDGSKPKAWYDTLSQLRDAHSNYEGFGKTGEFTLGTKIGNKIVFLLTHRHSDLAEPRPVDINEKKAEPMKAALDLKSGVMEGLDYRGEIVLAAYEPVRTPIGIFGIVAKIDLVEIQKPFILTAVIIMIAVFILMSWVSWMFFKFITPIVNRHKDSITALERSENLLSQSQNIAKIGTWDWNIQSNSIYWSDSMFTIFARSKKSGPPSYQEWEDYIFKEDLAKMYEDLESAYLTKNFNTKYRITTENDQIRYVQSVGKITDDKEGNPLRIIGLLRDITDETIARKKLKRQEEFLKKIYDNTPTLIIVLDEDLIINQVNRYVEVLTEYKKDEIIFKDCINSFIPKNEHKRAKEFFDLIVSNDEIQGDILLPLISKSGETHTINWRTTVYNHENKKYILAVGLDITKSMTLETKYKDLYESMRDGFGAIDLKGNLTEVNSAFCEMVGYSKIELLNMNISDITPNEWLEKEMEIISPLKGKYDFSPVYEKEYICKDGSIIPVELRTGTLTDNNDELNGYWALIRDISVRKKIEAELSEKEEMMISQSRQVAMGDMIAMIAHQWRQPITAITMVANNILMDLSFDEISFDTLKKDMDKIIHQTNYLSNTIDDFRNFFNPKNEKVAISLEEILNDALKIVSKSFENHNIEIELNILDKSKIEIFEKEMLQVLLIILNNAKDVIASNNITDGLVKVEIGIENDYNYIKITDNGGGIPDNLLPRLGEPYMTTKVSQGTGLGLYMSNIIVTKHMNGSLLWYNNDNYATIEIRIPIATNKG